jgi:hypothetical protein
MLTTLGNARSAISAIEGLPSEPLAYANAGCGKKLTGSVDLVWLTTAAGLSEPGAEACVL